ncbi:MAG: AAA family ATPase [Chloroflexota bacterium]|nr:AAA family ATPase [Chloroflexota bacterium]
MTRSPNPSFIKYCPLSLADLHALEFPEREWVVREALPRGSLTLFSAREKAGKSLLAVDLGGSVAAGEPFLDRAVRAGPVVLVPAEENLRDVRARIQARLGHRTDVPLHVLPVNTDEDDKLDLANPAAMAGLQAVIDEIQPVLLVLDPMRELHALAENDSDQMGPLLRPLRRLAHETDTAIVLIHHQGRGGTFRGSTAIRAACDQEWAFRRPVDEPPGSTELQGTLTIEGRFSPRQSLGIRFAEGGRWQLAVQALDSSPSARGQVLAHLREAEEPVTAEEIAAAIGVTVKTTQNILAEERRKGTQTISVVGTGRKNDPFCYVLANDTYQGALVIPDSRPF